MIQEISNMSTQLYNSEQHFIKKFNYTNSLYDNNYEIKAPKGHSNYYRGMNCPLWFYHKLCHRYFKETPHSLFRLKNHNGYLKKYLCKFCNKQYGSKIVSHKAILRYYGASTNTSLNKIFNNAGLAFRKKFNKTSLSKDFSILINPDGTPEQYINSRHKIWVLHNKCHHFFRIYPLTLLKHKHRVYFLCPFCKKCQLRINRFIRYNKEHSNTISYKVSKQTLLKFNILKIYYHNLKIRNNKYHKHPGGRRTNASFLRDVYTQPDNHNHTYTPTGKYKGNMVKIHWLYWGKHRAYSFMLSPNEFLNQGVRYKYNRRYRYKGERAVKEYCDYYGLREDIDYFHSFILPTNKSTALCLHADFYLPNIIYSSKYYNGIVIEYDGSQHFQASKHFGGKKALKNRQKRDHHKDVFCEKHHIKMIRIEKYHHNPHHYAYIKRLVVKTLNKKLLPTLYRNYLKDVDLQH